jgi:hypothetical protein
MAVLDATNRLRIGNEWMRRQTETLAGVTKTDLRAAVDATDAWIEANQASYNTALPAAFKNNASLAQKTFLFCLVARRRAGDLRAEEDG